MWRSGGGFYGWAPLGPGVNVSVSFFDGLAVPYNWWVFVPERYALSPSFYSYSIAPANNVTYITNTTVINNTYVDGGVRYVSGPPLQEIQRVSNNKVSVYDIASVNKPGKTSVQGSSVRTYRPQVTKSGAGSEKPAPKKVVTRDQFKNSQRDTRVQENNNAPRKQQADPSATEKKQLEQNNAGQRKQTDQSRPVEQKNNKAAPKKQQQINQPAPQTERKQVPQKNNNNRKVQTESPGKIDQPAAPAERKQVQQQKNNPPVIQERSQPKNQPVPQAERKQIPQQNRTVAQPPKQTQPAQQKAQPPAQQQKPQPAGKKKNGK